MNLLFICCIVLSCLVLLFFSMYVIFAHHNLIAIFSSFVYLL